MKLLFFTNVFPNPYQPTKGVFNLRLVQALAREHRLRVVSPISWWEEWKGRRRVGRRLRVERDDLNHGFPIHYPRFYYPPKIGRRYYGAFMAWSVAATIKRAGREFRPDVVIGYWAHPDGQVALRIGRSLGVPVIVLVGGSDVLLLTQNSSRRRLITRVLRHADAVVAVSHDLKTRLEEHGIDTARIHVVNRGVDTERFFSGDRVEARRKLRIDADVPLVLWVGRMVPVKGLEVLIEAMSLLRERGVHFRLALVGDGPLRPVLQTKVVRQGIADMVSFVGHVAHDDLPDWYRAANLTVLPSHSEGIPNVLRESMACGIPFIASKVGGIPEIADQPDQQLVAPGDPPALADAIARALAAGPDGLSVNGARVQSWAESSQALTRILDKLVRPSTKRESAPLPIGAEAS